MDDKKKTPCECPLAGFCTRHGIHKSAHLHKLCQNHAGYFAQWDACRGPGQNPYNCKKNTNKDLHQVDPIPQKIIKATKPKSKKPKTPSKLQMAKNFLKSAGAHVVNGMKHANDEVQQERIDICSDCPFISQDRGRCTKCGCILSVKIKWESSSCPIGKW